MLARIQVRCEHGLFVVIKRTKMDLIYCSYVVGTVISIPNLDRILYRVKYSVFYEGQGIEHIIVMHII